METLLKLVKYVATPEFFFGTVVGGVFIGLFVNLISPSVNAKISKFFAMYSKARATRNSKLKQEREERINLLINNVQEQHFAVSLATNKKVSAIIRCIAGLMALALAIAWLGILLNDYDAHKSTWELIKTSIACLMIGALGYILLSSSVSLFEESEDLVAEVHEARRRTNVDMTNNPSK